MPRRFTILCTAVIAGLALTAGGAQAASGPSITLLDDCEPASFNAVLGPGACTIDGETTFNALIGSLIATGSHPEWTIKPGNRTVKAGQRLDVRNYGGEAHTFSRTAQYGGGFVPELNHILGLTEIADGCQQPPSAEDPLLFERDSYSLKTGRGTPVGIGTHRFMCCIHPWMKATVTVTS
jgi:plastocyanin